MQDVFKLLDSGDFNSFEKCVKGGFLKRPCDPNLRNRDGDTLLFHAICTGVHKLSYGWRWPEVVLKAGADPNLACQTGVTPLMQSVWLACNAYKPDEIMVCKKIITLVLSNGAKVNQLGAWQQHRRLTALHIAAGMATSMQTAELLVQHHANVNSMDNQGLTPLDYASGKGPGLRSSPDENMIRFLRSHGGSSMSTKDIVDQNRTPSGVSSVSSANVNDQQSLTDVINSLRGKNVRSNAPEIVELLGRVLDLAPAGENNRCTVLVNSDGSVAGVVTGVNSKEKEKWSKSAKMSPPNPRAFTLMYSKSTQKSPDSGLAFLQRSAKQYLD